MTAIDAEVIICGAGIGGLTLAAICRQLGISYKVLERTETLQPVGAGISLSPNALRVLDQLGVYEKVLETAQKLRKLQIWRNNTQWNTVSLDNFEPTYGYPIVSAERHNFHRLLYAAAGEDEHVVLNAKVTDVIDVPGEPVRVVVEGGTEYRGHVVVGADGIRSAVRRALLRKNDLNKGNTIQFTGRVHFSGITSPLENCGPSEIGVANWMLYDQAILTTWPCQDNRQWYIGVKVCRQGSSPYPRFALSSGAMTSARKWHISGPDGSRRLVPEVMSPSSSAQHLSQPCGHCSVPVRVR